MKCLILAAGYATRLYPLTENFPKPLLEVGGKAILDWLVDDIDMAGCVGEDIVISNHKYAAHFAAWARGKSQRIAIVDDGTVSNETRLGAVRDVQFAIERMDLAEDLLIVAGDNVVDFSLTRFIAYAQEKGTSCILRYFEPEESKLRKTGVLEVDAHDKVLSMEEKPARPRTHWACPPFYYYTAADARRIPEGIAAGCGTDAPGSYIAWLCGKAPVHAMEMPGKRYDVGDIESYEWVKQNYRGIGASI